MSACFIPTQCKLSILKTKWCLPVLLTASVLISVTAVTAWTTCAFYLKHFQIFTNNKTLIEKKNTLISWKRKQESKLQNAFCIWYIVVIHNGDNRRLRWTKSNFSEVLFRLQREQAPWQILGTETNSSYSNYSRLRARGQQHNQYSYPQLAEPLSPCKT